MQRAQHTRMKTLLPHELLVLAGSHENQEMNRYRRLALRFLPFDTSISRLLETLAIECAERLREIGLAAERLHVTERMLSVPPLRKRRIDDSGDHFFILGNETAAKTLTQALIRERQSLRFYRQLQAANATPELHPMIEAFMKQSLMQCRILTESQDQWLLDESNVYRLRTA